MSNTYKGSRLLPIQKLALHVLGWGVLCGLSFFFHVVAFVVVILTFAYKINEFKFVYENTKGFPYDSRDDEYPYKPRHEQLSIPVTSYYESQPDDWDRYEGTELGTERESRLRTNLSESKVRWQ